MNNTGYNISSLLGTLADVHNDLWGSTQSRESDTSQKNLPVSEQGNSDGKAKENLSFPESLANFVDEHVQWTEALVFPESPDRLTPPDVWKFYREHARGVLQGNTEEYGIVLKRMKPLDDLTQYGDDIQITVVSADCVQVEFTVKHDISEANFIAVRAANDIMALLPVSQVDVVYHQGEDTIRQTFAI